VTPTEGQSPSSVVPQITSPFFIYETNIHWRSVQDDLGFELQRLSCNRQF
jgi:hypothetical protein